MSLSLTKFFSKKRSGPVDTIAAEIGLPTNVSHKFHVSKNAETGQLEGLPDPWIRLLNTQISKSEQDEHPDAALQAIKFYNYSIKRKPPDQEVFKPFVTQDLIEEESQEIDNILTKKYRSNDSDDDVLISERQSTDDQARRLPELPPKVNKPPKPPPKPAPRKCNDRVDKTLTEILEDLNTYQIDDDLSLEKDVMSSEIEESPILRRKTECIDIRLSKEQIYEELRAICQRGDPYLRFERIKQVGAGASGTVFIATDRNQNSQRVSSSKSSEFPRCLSCR